MPSSRREFLQTGAAAMAGLWLPKLSGPTPFFRQRAVDFQPTWESLAQYQTPDWFRDAKFGIWAHWGPQCVPEQGDWYARQMYQQGNRDYIEHVARYGHPSQSGFKDVIHQWNAEDWDPDELDVALQAGGRAVLHRARQPPRQLRPLGLEASAVELGPTSARRRI